MPFADFPDFGACLKAMRKKYKKKGVAEKVCGKLQALHEKKHEINNIKNKILEEKLDLLRIRRELEDNKKWMQKAFAKKKGSLKSWCKRHGYGEEVNQKCISAAAKAGGAIARKANAAVNANPGKWKYPKGD